MDHVIILPMNIIPSWAKFSILTGSVTSEQQNNTYIIVFRTLFLIKLPIHYHSWKVGSRSCFQVGHSQRCVPKQSRLNTFQTNECSWQVLVSILLQSIFLVVFVLERLMTRTRAPQSWLNYYCESWKVLWEEFIFFIHDRHKLQDCFELKW